MRELQCLWYRRATNFLIVKRTNASRNAKEWVREIPIFLSKKKRVVVADQENSNGHDIFWQLLSQLIKDFSQVDYGSRASLLGQRTADINRYTKSFDVKQVEIWSDSVRKWVKGIIDKTEKQDRSLFVNCGKASKLNMNLMVVYSMNLHLR